MYKFEYNKKRCILEVKPDNPCNVYKYTINKKRFTKGHQFVAKGGQFPIKEGARVIICGQSKWPEKFKLIDAFNLALPFKVKCHNCRGWGSSHQQFYNYSDPRHCVLKRICVHCYGTGKIKTSLRKWISWRLFERGLKKTTLT